MSWIISTPGSEIPHARSFHAATEISDDKMLIFGGCYSALEEDKEKNFLNDLWLYNNVTLKWTKLETSGETPSPRAQSTFTRISGKEELLVRNNF